MAYIIIKEPARHAKIDVTVLETSADLKAWLADSSIKEGQLIAEIKCWRKAVKDGPRIILEPIKISEVLGHPDDSEYRPSIKLHPGDSL